MRLDEDEGECFLLSLMPVWGDVFLALTCGSVCAATTGCIVCTNSQRKRDLTPCSPVWFGCIWQGGRVSIKVLRVSRAHGRDRTLKLKLASVISVTAGRRILFIPPLTFRGKGRLFHRYYSSSESRATNYLIWRPQKNQQTNLWLKSEGKYQHITRNNHSCCQVQLLRWPLELLLGMHNEHFKKLLPLNASICCRLSSYF